jgi:protocatechuate 3,4-dioxygenase, alpha subunit
MTKPVATTPVAHLGITPSATVGPYFKYGLTPAGQYAWTDTFPTSAVTLDAAGERVLIAGRVLDGDNVGVPDAMIEIWQADSTGRYAHPLHGSSGNTAFKGFARVDTDKAGHYRIETIKPGKVAIPEGSIQAPHILICLFARGMLKHVFTRVYFADEAAANAKDPVLGLVPAKRRPTLIAERMGNTYQFDIRIQGGAETVFFDV